MYQNKKIVVFGVSQDKSKYGYKIFSTLLKKGFSVYAVNPKGGEVEGRQVYACLADVPASAEVALVVVPPAVSPSVVAQCVQAGVKEIWFQPGAQNPVAFAAAEAASMNAVDGCFMAENGLW